MIAPDVENRKRAENASFALLMAKYNSELRTVGTKSMPQTCNPQLAHLFVSNTH